MTELRIYPEDNRVVAVFNETNDNVLFSSLNYSNSDKDDEYTYVRMSLTELMENLKKNIPKE